MSELIFDKEKGKKIMILLDLLAQPEIQVIISTNGMTGHDLSDEGKALIREAICCTGAMYQISPSEVFPAGYVPTPYKNSKKWN